MLELAFSLIKRTLSKVILSIKEKIPGRNGKIQKRVSIRSEAKRIGEKIKEKEESQVKKIKGSETAKIKNNSNGCK